MINRKVKTTLVGKEELFRVIALGEATRMPILFVGVPGVAKTQTLIDYAAAMSGYDKQKAREETFVIELDEGTKSSEIKGRPNMNELLVNKKYKIDAPITEARYVLINEVDKGSSAVRNTMLSVMREKALFLGSDIRQCKWQLFAGSCNIIPDDQNENPFWDRFLIKFEVNRIKVSDIYGKAWQQKQIELNLDIPEKSDLDTTNIDDKMMAEFAKIIYKSVSDRTLMALPVMVKAIKHIWAFADAEAIMKACEFVAPKHVQKLSEKLEDPAIVSVKSKIRGLGSITDSDVLMTTIQTIDNEIAQLKNNPAYVNQAPDLDKMLKDTVDKNENCQNLIKALQEKSSKFEKLSGGVNRDAMAVDADGSVKAGN